MTVYIGACYFYEIVVLNIGQYFSFAPVDIYYTVYYLQCVARHCYHSFDIILSLVNRSCDNTTEVGFVIVDSFSAITSYELILSYVTLIYFTYCVAGGEVEHYRVSAFYVAYSGKTSIWKLRMCDV